jgi:hypothetical protein
VHASDLVFVIVGEVLALTFLGLSVWKRGFSRFPYLTLYAFSLLACDALRFGFLNLYGMRSKQYFYAFYYSDFWLVMLRYVVILSVFDLILRDSPFRLVARRAFFAFFAFVGVISYAYLSSNTHNFYSKLVLEFQQNLYFACVVLTVLLTVTLAHLRLTDPQLRMLVYGLGASAALQAGGYAFQNILPKEMQANWSAVVARLNPLATQAMLVLWCYALTGVTSPSKARDSAPAHGAEHGTEEEAFHLGSVLAKVEVRA